MPWDGVCLHTACRTESLCGLGTRSLHKLKLSFELGLSVLDFVWRLQASTAGSWDLVIDIQQAMECISFHLGTICFELKSTSQEHSPRMQEAVTYSDSWLRQSDPKKRWWVANITASLDHLDYDCVLVAGSVHVLGQCAKWSFGMRSKHTFTSSQSVEWVHSTVCSAFYSRPNTSYREIQRILDLIKTLPGMCLTVNKKKPKTVHDKQQLGALCKLALFI